MSGQYDLIVIGAGISGLSMAFEAQQAGLNVLVLEKREHAGGCFDSAMVNDDVPFWLEMGTHTCFNSYGRLLTLLEQLDLIDQLVPREKLRYRMLVDDTLCSIPSRLIFFELLANSWHIFSRRKEGKSVADYYRAIVGKKNYKNVFRHAFNAVTCQQADDLPADMLFRKRPRDKSVMRSYTFSEGLGRIINELEQRVTCRKGVEVEHIAYDESGFTITLHGETLHTNKLACATPAPAAARLLKDTFSDLAECLSWVDEVEIESVGIVVEKEDLELRPLAGIIAADGDFYSAVSRDIVPHPTYRGLTFHFKPGLLSDEEKLDRIRSLLNLGRGQVAHCFHKTNRLPAPDMGHHALMAKVGDLLHGLPLALIGNYFEGVAVEDCLVRTESEFKRICQHK